MAPAPNRYHQDISRNLEFILLRYLASHPIGRLYHAPFDVYLDEHNVFQPDILFVGEANKAILVDEGAHGAPDFIVEILSPSTEGLDLGGKRRVYGERGVRELWIVDPAALRIDVYLQPDFSIPARIVTANDVLESPLFPGLKFDAREIFAR